MNEQRNAEIAKHSKIQTTLRAEIFVQHSLCGLFLALAIHQILNDTSLVLLFYIIAVLFYASAITDNQSTLRLTQATLAKLREDNEQS